MNDFQHFESGKLYLVTSARTVILVESKNASKFKLNGHDCFEVLCETIHIERGDVIFVTETVGYKVYFLHTPRSSNSADACTCYDDGRGLIKNTKLIA